MPRQLIAAGLVLAAAGCSTDPDTASRNEAGPAVTATRKPDAIIFQKPVALSAYKPCGTDNLQRSICMTELMLGDIRKNYDWPSGGGIAEIRQVSSTSYTVSLPQEERTDLFTYEFAVSDKAVSITSRTAGTQSY